MDARRSMRDASSSCWRRVWTTFIPRHKPVLPAIKSSSASLEQALLESLCSLMVLTCSFRPASVSWVCWMDDDVPAQYIRAHPFVTNTITTNASRQLEPKRSRHSRVRRTVAAVETMGGRGKDYATSLHNLS
ncbi:hypothetical protein BDZ97DRAFT_1393504 [Flammula alnicola]|nr:hypothetical protein BDZ97DRAFT_1393504 [Flammula alnicola]